MNVSQNNDFSEDGASPFPDGSQYRAASVKISGVHMAKYYIFTGIYGISPYSNADLDSVPMNPDGFFLPSELVADNADEAIFDDKLSDTELFESSLYNMAMEESDSNVAPFFDMDDAEPIKVEITVEGTVCRYADGKISVEYNTNSYANLEVFPDETAALTSTENDLGHITFEKGKESVYSCFGDTKKGYVPAVNFGVFTNNISFSHTDDGFNLSLDYIIFLDKSIRETARVEIEVRYKPLPETSVDLP